MVAIQETKMMKVNDWLVNHIWGNDKNKWSMVPSAGLSRGLLTIWDEE